MYIFLIKEIREEKGMSQQELANKVNISRSYLSEIENNKINNISFNLVLEIAAALNVDIKKIYVAVSDIEELRNELHKSIDEHGINSEETLKISKLIDRLINLKMEENDML